MSKQFKASNGYVIEPRPRPYSGIVVRLPDGRNSLDEYDYLGPQDIDALEEWFKDGRKFSGEWEKPGVGELWELETTQGTTYRLFSVYESDGSVVFMAADGRYYEPNDPLFIGGKKLA